VALLILKGEPMRESNIERTRFAIRLHHFFRKGLDSTASSICWNAINLMDNQDWRLFCARLYDTGKVNRWNCEASVLAGDSARNLLLIGIMILEDWEYERIDKIVWD
jgi:hypothetical protein